MENKPIKQANKPRRHDSMMSSIFAVHFDAANSRRLTYRVSKNSANLAAITLFCLHIYVEI